MPFTRERPVSPLDGVWIKDDFLSNEALTDAAIGELNWEIVTIGNASTYAYLAPSAAGEAGILRQTTAATADGDGSVLRLDEDSWVFGGEGGGFGFKFQYPVELASSNFRVGIETSVTATAPTDGIWILSDAGVLTVEADSADHGDSSAAITGISTLTSGTTAVVATWHTVEVKWSGANGQGGPRLVEAFVDGEIGATVFCALDDDETAEPKITHWQDSGGADAVIWDLDYVEFWQWR
jgi:hypothetical protein